MLRLPDFQSWWYDREKRTRLLGAALIASCFGCGIAYGSWTRVCAAERCPSISRVIQTNPQQTAKVYAADGRLITEFGIERRTVLPLSEMPMSVREGVYVLGFFAALTVATLTVLIAVLVNQ